MSQEANDSDSASRKMRDSLEKDLEMSDSESSGPSSAGPQREKRGRIILDSDEDNDDVKESEEREDEDEQSGEEYIVEKILAQKKRGKKTLYLIKWKDWPDSSNTWEPEEHLSCPELLEEFKREHARKQSKKTEKLDTSKKSEAKKKPRERVTRDAKKDRRPKTQSKESNNKVRESLACDNLVDLYHLIGFY